MKLRILLALFAFVLILASCGETEPNALFADASPENSRIRIYVSDGERTVEYQLKSAERSAELLEALTNTTAAPTEVKTEDVKLPVYSFSVGTADGRGLQMSWSSDIRCSTRTAGIPS